MPKYSAQSASAAKLLQKKGQKMTLVRANMAAPYDPLNPVAYTAGASTNEDTFGAVLPASNGTIEAFDNRLLGTPQLRQSFRFVILSGESLTLTPLNGDNLITNEGTYKVLGSTPLNPSGDGPIIYNVGCTFNP